MLKDQQGIYSHLVKKLTKCGVAVQAVTDLPTDARYVIDLRGLDPINTTEQALAMNTACFKMAFQLGMQLVTQPGLLVVLQNTGGCFAIDYDAGVRAWSAGIAGLAKTADKEWPEATVRVIDIDAEVLGKKQIADYIFDELLEGGDELEIGINGQGLRQKPQLMAEGTLPLTTLPFKKPIGVILVTGGARGVTTACLQALAERYPEFSFALLGRTALVDEPVFLTSCQDEREIKRLLLNKYQQQGQVVSPKVLNQEAQNILNMRIMKANIALLKSMCKACEYYSTDVNDLTQLTQTITHIRQTMGPIEGIIHAAGILADQYINKKSLEDYFKVFNTKVLGIKNLLQATQSDHLRYFACFSSVAARTGNQGQVDYAMANEVLNKVSQQFKRQHPDCYINSFNWGPWDGGMVSPQLKAHFEQQGVGLISLSAGSKFFADHFVTKYDVVETVIGSGLAQIDHVHTSTSKRQLSKWIHKQTDPVLTCHVLWGVPVIPMAFLMEWSYLALVDHYSLNEVSLKNIRANKAIKLDAFSTGGHWLQLDVVAENNNFMIAIYPESEHTPSINLILQGNQYSNKNQQPDLEVLKFTKQVSSPVFKKQAIYPEILFHQNYFRVIKSVDTINENTLYATLELELPDPTRIQAFFLDGALQLGLIVMFVRYKTAALPVTVAGVHFYRRTLGKKVYCCCEIVEHSSLSITTHVSLFDEDGYLLMSLEGIQSMSIEGYQVTTQNKNLSEVAL